MLKYRPTKYTLAQRMLMAMGLDDMRLEGHHGGKRESFTKTGPGRCHVEGPIAAPTKPTAKPPIGHLVGLHKASPDKRLRRACVKLSGIRQHKREQRAAKTLPAGLVD